MGANPSEQGVTGSAAHYGNVAVFARPRTELRRVTVHEHDDRNDCETVRGVGFSWRCTCGARGPIQGSRDAALESKREHERGHRH